MDTPTAITDAVNRALNHDDIETTIEDAVKATVVRSIKDHLSSYSDFGKTIDEAVKSALQFKPIDLPSYNDLIVKLVRNAVKEHTEAAIAAQVEKQVKDLFEPPPQELKLSELVEMYVQRIRSGNDDGCVCYGESMANVVVSEPERGLWTSIKLYESEGDRDEEIYIGIHLQSDSDADGDDDDHISPPRGHIYHLRFNDRDVENKMFVDYLRGLERMLFQMKAQKCHLVLDCDPADLDLDTSPQH